MMGHEDHSFTREKLRCGMLCESHETGFKNERVKLEIEMFSFFRYGFKRVRVTEEWTPTEYCLLYAFCFLTALGRLRFDGLR